MRELPESNDSHDRCECNKKQHCDRVVQRRLDNCLNGTEPWLVDGQQRNVVRRGEPDARGEQLMEASG